MLFARGGVASTRGVAHSGSWAPPAAGRRRCAACHAKRGPRKKTEADDGVPAGDPIEAPKKRGRRPKAAQDVQAAAAARLDDVISYEADVTSSLELDYEEVGDASASGASAAGGAGRALPDTLPFATLDEGEEGLGARLLRGSQLGGRPRTAAAAGAAAEGGGGADEYSERDESAGEIVVPEHRAPRTPREAQHLEEEVVWTQHWEELWQREAFEDQAWTYHYLQNDEGVNIYANARALVSVTAAVEKDDHDSGNDDISMTWPTWARAEHIFAPLWPEFNEFVRDNIEDLKWRLPPGAEDDELDVMDDALLFADDDDAVDDGSDGGGVVAAGGGASGSAGFDAFLAGVLPGTSDGGDSGAAGYLEELLAGADEEAVGPGVEDE